MRNIALCLSAAAAAFVIGCTASDLQQITQDVSLAAGASTEEAARYGQAAANIHRAARGFTVQEEIGIGQGVALAALQRFGPLTKDEALLRYVNLVGLSCADTCDRPELPFKFAVIDSPMVNAFAGPGGYVFTTTGTLKLMKNEAELAGVLSHEIGHVTQKHSLKTLRRSKLFEAGFDIAGGKFKERYGAMTDLINDMLFNKGLDKNMEFEADHYGTEFAYRAGYNPAGLRNFLITLQKQHGASGGWFQTHPPLDDRIPRLNSLLQAEMPDAQSYALLQKRYQDSVLARLK